MLMGRINHYSVLNVCIIHNQGHHKDIKNEINRGSKTEITIRNDHSDKRKDSVHADEVAHNEPGDSLIVSDQGSYKNTHNSSNNIVFLVTVFPKA